MLSKFLVSICSVLVVSPFGISNGHSWEFANANTELVSQHISGLQGLDLHHPDISPDGEHIAFSAAVDGFRHSTIWVQNISNGKTRRLTEVDSTNTKFGDVAVRWSPNGDKLVFGSDRGLEPHIYVIDVDGKNLRKITNDPVATGTTWLAWEAIATWTSDSKSIVYAETYTGDEASHSQIIEHDVETDEKKILYRFPKSKIWAPGLSPDGASIVFVENPGKPDVGLGLLDVKTQVTKTIACDVEGPMWPRWSPDGKWIGFQSWVGGWKTYLLPVDGGKATVVGPGGQVASQVPSFTPDGKALIYHINAEIDFSVSTLETETLSTSVFLDSLEVIGGAGRWVSWSPNSRYITFIKKNKDHEEFLSGFLYTFDIKKEVLSAPIDVLTVKWGGAYKLPVWVEDNTGFYAFVSKDETIELAFVKVSDFSVNLVTDSGTHKHSVALSPDQELVAYVSGGKGDENIWLFDTVLGESYQLTNDQSRKTNLSFSPDGTEILFHQENPDTRIDIMSLNLGTNEISQETTENYWEWNSNWIDQNTISYTARLEGYDHDVWIKKSRGSDSYELIIEGTNEESIRQPKLSTDGKTIYYSLGGWNAPLVSHDIASNKKTFLLRNATFPIASTDLSYFAFLKMNKAKNATIVRENIEHLTSVPKIP